MLKVGDELLCKKTYDVGNIIEGKYYTITDVFADRIYLLDAYYYFPFAYNYIWNFFLYTTRSKENEIKKIKTMLNDVKSR